MNIGIDIRPLLTSPKTGVGEYTQNLLNAIFELDKKNQYFLFSNSINTDAKSGASDCGWDGENIHLTHTHWPNKLFNASTIILKYPKIDQTTLHKLDVFYSPNIGFTSVSKKTRFAITIHDLSFEFFPEFYSPRQRLWHNIINPKKQCERANIIFAPSENTKNDIVNIYKINPDKIKVIYPGLSSVFKVEEKLEQKEIDGTKTKYNLPNNYILYLGAIESRKNILGLIGAFEKLNTNHALVLAGPGGWGGKEIHNYAEKSNRKNDIKFLGFIPEKDKPALYANASVFVYPSFYEGFGFPVLEAMSQGTPVIASNRSSLPEVVCSAARLINPNYSDEIYFALKELLENKIIREKQIKNGLDQAVKFSWNGAAKNWLSALDILN